MKPWIVYGRAGSKDLERLLAVRLVNVAETLHAYAREVLGSKAADRAFVTDLDMQGVKK
ncbi:hypothetical protein KDW78_24105 [Burkholderia cenocepacia]|uniref:hypothetical protein n=1 Tax=Burkholderia cenocepacia TaxID=95486 RepID=UPI00158DE8F8|nr:hypothetical protein [Burkholderia cenocepacia]MBR7956969.1 hypothetical protein [Burkholderia cenocepacia]